jgi:uncharacterized cupredoxin-like copper-binding protein
MERHEGVAGKGMKKRRVWIPLLLTIAVACTTQSEPTGETSPDRTISIVMRDDFTYDPPLIEIVPEEVVEFQISNEGGVVHEFLVGDEARRAEFEREMAVGGHEAHGAEAPGVSVEPGEEESFVFKFPDKERELFYGCHEPGHYAAGMKGSFRFGTEG